MLNKIFLSISDLHKAFKVAYHSLEAKKKLNNLENQNKQLLDAITLKFYIIAASKKKT
jgi:hypothetical protein